MIITDQPPSGEGHPSPKGVPTLLLFGTPNILNLL